MIVLDTNVLSELMRRLPAAAVLEWFSAQSAAALFTTSVSQAEILFGIYLLPEGKRRRALAEQADAMFKEDFAGRVLGFDMAAAPHYATIASQYRSRGRTIQPEDGMIAAIATAHRATIATRDRDFQGCGIPLINPWMSV
ncbi:MAG: type II toxin-antitoxin system VapC family toxin [Pseudomonadota bacterium]